MGYESEVLVLEDNLQRKLREATYYFQYHQYRSWSSLKPYIVFILTGQCPSHVATTAMPNCLCQCHAKTIHT